MSIETAPDIAAIAAGLAKEHRNALKRARDWGEGYVVCQVGTARGTAPLGLTVRSIYGMCLTPLGIAVRNHMAQETAR